MTTTKKVQGTAISIPAGVALGASVSLLLTCMLAVLLTWQLLDGRIEEKILGYALMGIHLIASFAGSSFSAAKTKRRRMLVCCITGAVYFLIMIGITAVLFGGNYQGTGVTGVLVMLGSVASGMLGLTRSRHGQKRYKKYRSS